MIPEKRYLLEPDESRGRRFRAVSTLHPFVRVCEARKVTESPQCAVREILAVLISRLVLYQGSIFGYDGLPVRRQRLPPTDWKSVVQIQFNPNFKG